MQKSGNQKSVPSSDPHADFGELQSNMNTRIIGQPALVDRLLISLLSNGHLLVEGAPGLAKTTAIKCLANAIEGDFHRIQFTPDLLPGDVTGTDVYRPQVGSQTLPAIEVHWWDTRHDQARVAHLPEREISVRQPPPSDQQAIQPDAFMRPIQDVISTPQASLGWWLGAALFMLWLITALAWLRTRKRPAGAPRGGAGRYSSESQSAETGVSGRRLGTGKPGPARLSAVAVA